MATYPANYKYVSNAGPPVPPETEADTLFGGPKLRDPTRSRRRGRATLENLDMVRSGFLANLNNLIPIAENPTDDELDNHPNKAALDRIFSSSADLKTGDTRAGGMIGVGGSPQYTRYSDIRSKGLISRRRDVTIQNGKGEIGMGRLYSETHDDLQELLYLQFGVVMFNSLGGFLSTFSDQALTKLATTGKAEGFMFQVGRIVGLTLAFRVWHPAISVLGAISWGARAIFASRSSRFYTVNPQMMLYWSTVNTLVNQLVINRGIIPRINHMDANEKEKANELIQSLEDMMPGMFNRTRGVDVPAIISVAHRRADKALGIASKIRALMKLKPKPESVGATIYSEALARHRDEVEKMMTSIDYDETSVAGGIEVRGNLDRLVAIAKRSRWNWSKSRENPGDSTNMLAQKPKEYMGGEKAVSYGSEEYSPQEAALKISKKEPEDVEVHWDGDKIINLVEPSQDPENQDGAGYYNTLTSYAKEGVSWAVFRVNHIKSTNENFSNSTSDNALGSGLNSVASTARSVKFTFAGGNLGDNMIMDGIESAISGIGSFLKGNIDGFTFGLAGSLMDLLRGVNVEIPNYWERSDAEISTNTYSMDLVVPYNNPFSHIQNIDIPLCMLLAGVLPIKSGAQSHVSPFVCRAHLLGKTKSEVSMIQSVSITRGTTNLPFDKHGHALGVKVEFTVVNLSPAISTPVSIGSVFRPAEWVLDQDSSIYEYLQTMAGMTLEEQVLSFANLQVRFASMSRTISRLTDPTAWAHLTHQYVPNIPVVGGIYGGIGALLHNNAVMKGEVSR